MCIWELTLDIIEISEFPNKICVTNLQRNDTIDVDTCIWELTAPNVDNHENQGTSHEWSPTIWNGSHHLKNKRNYIQLVIADIII